MGLDTDRAIDEINSELICPICEEIVDDPIECSNCEKAFCSQCIQDWSSVKKECPNRCPKLDLRSSHRFFRTMWESVIIKCSRYREGCSAVMQMQYIKKHEMLECGFRPVICEHSECNQEVLFKDYQQHLLECKFKEIPCEKYSQISRYMIKTNILAYLILGKKPKN